MTMGYGAMIVSDSAPGELLDKHLELQGLAGKTYLTQVGDSLGAQVARCRPKAILALGAQSTKTLTGERFPLGELVGKLCFTPKSNWPVIPCWGTAYVERHPLKGGDFVEAILNWKCLIQLRSRP